MFRSNDVLCFYHLEIQMSQNRQIRYANSTDIAHLVYEYKSVCDIWKSLENVLLLKVSWRNIVIGFCEDSSERSIILINLFSFIACKI